MQSDVLRGSLGFDGFIVSDFAALCDAMGVDNSFKTFNGHFYSQNGTETSKLALEAGTDANLGVRVRVRVGVRACVRVRVRV